MNLDREKARQAVDKALAPLYRGDSTTLLAVRESILDALEGCVVEDPRLARLNDLCDERELKVEESVSRTFYGDPYPALLSTVEVRAIMKGDSA